MLVPLPFRRRRQPLVRRPQRRHETRRCGAGRRQRRRGHRSRALQQFSKASDGIHHVHEQNLLPISSLGDVRYGATKARLDLADTMLAPEERQGQTEADIAADDQVVAKAWAAYTATDMTGREEAVQRFEESWAAYRQLGDAELLPIAKGEDTALFDRVRTAEAAPLLTEAFGALDQLVESRRGARSRRSRPSTPTTAGAAPCCCSSCSWAWPWPACWPGTWPGGSRVRWARCPRC